MSTNPYAPPEAHVADMPEPATSTSGDEGLQPSFFPVSLLKLAVLSLCTLGLYELYWFYKNWQFIRAREQSRLVPFLRAFFAVLFCYPCFCRIRDHGVALGLKPPLTAGAFAAGWILTTIAWKLPDPYWLVTLLAVFFLFPVQAYVNRINAACAPSHDRNSRFGAWNWVAVVVGGIWLILAMIGTFLPQR